MCSKGGQQVYKRCRKGVQKVYKRCRKGWTTGIQKV